MRTAKPKPPKKPRGRPTDCTVELSDRICEYLANGVPMARIALMDDMPAYSTLKRWQRENTEFEALSARAKEDGTHYLGEDSLRIADDLSLDPQHKKIMIDTRLRLIGKWNSKAYGDKLTQEHTGADGGPVQFTTIYENGPKSGTS
jgi:hypothetical protein